MAVVDGWPAQALAVDQIELRKNLAGLIVRDTSGNARAGVFPRHTNPLVTSTGTMNVSVAAFEAAVVRAGGPVFISNDGSVNVLLPNAPGANSRYDVVYVRQKENGYGGLADGSNGPEITYVSGTAAASPTVPSVPTGAIPLATVLIPSTATATNSSGVVITPVFPYTTVTGGRIWVRNATELAAVTGFPQETLAYQLDAGVTFRYYALYNGSTNLPGARVAGWYPNPGEDVFIRLGGSGVQQNLPAATDSVQAAAFGTPTAVPGFFTWNGTNGQLQVLVEGRYDLLARVQISNVAGTMQTGIRKNSTAIGPDASSLGFEDFAVVTGASHHSNVDARDVPLLTSDIVRVVVRHSAAALTNLNQVDGAMLFHVKWRGVIHA